jgi:hypothetical protein
MKKFKQGDYVHIPSKVMMLFYEKKDKKGEWYRSTRFLNSVILEIPQKLMFVSSPHPEFCEVFYEGKLWTVPSRYVYDTGEES